MGLNHVYFLERENILAICYSIIIIIFLFPYIYILFSFIVLCQTFCKLPLSWDYFNITSSNISKNLVSTQYSNTVYHSSYSKKKNWNSVLNFTNKGETQYNNTIIGNTWNIVCHSTETTHCILPVLKNKVKHW